MKLYNTLTKKIEEFKPLVDKKVNLFVCGPTVYDDSHIGHAKTYIQMDTLARTLRALGYEVFYLQNITNIDDKIIARANEKKVDWGVLAKQHEEAYLEDMKAINNTAVTKYARATDYIADIISQVQILLDKGHAYKIDDGIYFEVSTFKGYGKLSGRTEVKKDDAQTRIDHSDEKRGWNDFCLWKFPKDGEPVWEAPFGAGRPGWHVEDTAITEHFFGPQYDIHGGAVDLIFPHHEAEITQMESISGRAPLAKYWTHVGFLNIAHAKMSKSAGNFFTIKQVLQKGYDPMAIRLFMLQSHYRSQINFSWELLDAAQTRLKTYRAMADLRWQIKDGVKKENDFDTLTRAVMESMQNDLNAPMALARISEIADAQNEPVSTKSKEKFIGFLKILDNIFGLELLSSADIIANQKQILNEREHARAASNWKKSDELRGQLEKQGIGVRDTGSGQIWHRL